jgi:hypothetical protein
MDYDDDQDDMDEDENDDEDNDDEDGEDIMVDGVGLEDRNIERQRMHYCLAARSSN